MWPPLDPPPFTEVDLLGAPFSSVEWCATIVTQQLGTSSWVHRMCGEDKGEGGLDGWANLSQHVD